MAFIDHIHTFQKCDINQYVPFVVNGQTVGHIRRADTAVMLSDFPDVFSVNDKALTLLDKYENFENRTHAVKGVIDALIHQGKFPPIPAPIAKEIFPVGARRTKPFLTIPRAYAHHFGILSYGTHANCIAPNGDLWVARRSRSKGTYPGMLDQLVAGGLPYGQSPLEGIIREGEEEAGISPEYTAKHAQSVSMLSYARDSKYGLEHEIIYLYDLRMPDNFEPVAIDGEVEEFFTLPVEDVMRLTRDTQEFKPNCNLVNMDYLIRNGYITPENEPDFEVICNGLQSNTSIL